MKVVRYLIIFLLFLCWTGGSTLSAQVNDTIIGKKATEKEANGLQKLEDLSKKSKFTRWMHKMVFKRAQKQVQQTDRQAINPQEIDFDYEKYEGKIIRNINIVTMDPFGYSISDSTRVPVKKLDLIGNRLHLKTKQFTIRNMLLFKRNQPLDSLKVKESERIIRSQSYVRRVVVKPIPIPNSTDSVDIHIRVLDAWSIYPTGSISTSSMRLKVTSRNFAGLGHYFSNQYRTRFKEGQHAYASQYQINNIANTFINAGILYDIDLAENYVKTVYAERPFYSPLARWAGGITFNQTFYKDSIPNLDNVYKLEHFKSNYFDVWAGHSFPLFERVKNVRVITNLVTSFRYFSRDYTESPPGEFDPYNYFSDSKLYLATVGLNSINYVQDRFIFNYDRIEDIAVGKIFSVTAGQQRKNKINRLYLGTRFALGRYNPSGYFGGEVQWGTYFNGNNLEESVLRVQGVYFSKVWHWGRWRFRQFFNPEFVYGYNRLDFDKDKISLNGRNGIDGFDSYHLRGTKKLLLNFQTQSYAPTEWLGFRLSPFLTASLGMLGDIQDTFLNNELYTSFGIGVLITNDYLTFSNIQFSFSFYPTIPGQGKNIFKTNNLRNSNFELQNFSYGKPQLVPYQ